MAVEVAAGSPRKKAELDQEPSDGSLKARRAGETCPEGNIPGDRRLKARREGPAPVVQGPADAADVPAPSPGLGSFDLLDRKFVGLVKVDRNNAGLSTSSAAAYDHGRPIDRCGHDQTAIVVGVVAQQLNAAGSTPGDGWLPAKPRGKGRAGLYYKLFVFMQRWKERKYWPPRAGRVPCRSFPR